MMKTPALFATLAIAGCIGCFATLSARADTVYKFTLYAGSPGSVDGAGSAAEFDHPGGIACDDNENLYVTDSQSGTIRKVTPAGVVTTISGAVGVFGSADGQGLSARFNWPQGIATDLAGNLYVADARNCTVRKIDAQGVVSTLAGTAGATGSADGTGASARFFGPSGPAVDAAGNVFVADIVNCTIRKITPNGAVSTFAGLAGQAGSQDGTGAAARFNGPTCVAIDASGNLFVADQNNATIREITPAGVVTTWAGVAGQTGNSGSSLATLRFTLPAGLAFDAAGNLYVADQGTYTVRWISPSGTVDLVTGVNEPTAVCVGKSGTIYVADTDNDRVCAITGGALSVLAGKANGHAGQADGAALSSRFNTPAGLALNSSGDLYVADANNNTIRQVSSAGQTTTIAGAAGLAGTTDGHAGSARFASPKGVALMADGSVIVADTGNHSIRKITAAGDVSTVAGASGVSGKVDGVGANARFNSPMGVAVDGSGAIFVADTTNHAIRRIAADGTVSTFAGSLGNSGSVDGTGTAARFNQPRAIAFAPSGALIVADTGNGAVRSISPQGAVTTLAHSGTPLGVAVDPQGNVFVADDNTGDVLMISPQGSISTLVGDTTVFGKAENSFLLDGGIAVDAAGNVYVSESTHHAIQRGSLPVVAKITPTISWSAPAPIPLGTALSATQLNATSSVPGTFTYSPAIGTVPSAGQQTLSVTFTPTDQSTYASATAQVTLLVEAANLARMVNIATRAYCSSGNAVTIGGFVITGSGTKQVLIRAVGPSLAAQGLPASEVLADPTMEVHQGSTVIARNDNWNDNDNSSQITATAQRVGATALDSADHASSALLTQLQPGVYTFVVSGKAGSSGVVLLEVYDADAGAPTASFVNIATRAYATTGSGVAIGGFVVSGTSAKRVLLRAVGPTLVSSGLGVNEVLADPSIELHQGSGIVAVNDDWQANANASDIVAAAARIGATPLDHADAKSAALLLSLDPGAYTFIASGKNNTSGVVLVEVYDAD